MDNVTPQRADELADAMITTCITRRAESSLVRERVKVAVASITTPQDEPAATTYGLRR